MVIVAIVVASLLALWGWAKGPDIVDSFGYWLDKNLHPEDHAKQQAEIAAWRDGQTTISH